MRFKIVLPVLSVLLACSAYAQEHRHPVSVATSNEKTITASIANVNVITQADRPVHFYSDLVQGRLVAVNFIFTECGTVCPLMGLRYAQLQALLGPQARDVTLLSISIDPLNDTPARLAQWSQKFGAKPGWTLVTGGKADIDTLVKSLGSSAVDPTSHSPLLIVIDDRHGGPWQRLDGLADPSTIARILREHLALPVRQ
ncbi:SCO family protein [Pseudolysobacter antarcticus]|uniref:SCO family protein n=1 Tax=Pseudolysobacter antarcticus TaxID=2511995 RepID=A0A411HPF0_9GAMM|nr:SCO family protein [Pseudolysobacter antarcticus]QBB72342.1 SCO family protein [Pseudolysobacter antarcticus]